MLMLVLVLLLVIELEIRDQRSEASSRSLEAKGGSDDISAMWSQFVTR